MAPSSIPEPSGRRILVRAGTRQPLPRSHVALWKQQSRRHRRRSTGTGGAGVVRAASDDAPPVVRAAVGAVTELLRALSPNKKKPGQSSRTVALEIRIHAMSASHFSFFFCGPVAHAGMLLRVRQRSWIRRRLAPASTTCSPCLKTIIGAPTSSPGKTVINSSRNAGDFTPGIYTEDCLFEDPTIKFRGRSRYAQNLDLLVPFFDSPSLELENIEKGSRVGTEFIKATWVLRTYLRLPWLPLIAIRGNTTYDLNHEYKVTRHSESWDVSALEAIGQIIVSAPPEQKGS